MDEKQKTTPHNFPGSITRKPLKIGVLLRGGGSKTRYIVVLASGAMPGCFLSEINEPIFSPFSLLNKFAGSTAR
jgi:hypothetical protein